MLRAMDDTSNPSPKKPRMGSASRQTDQAMERAFAKAGKSSKRSARSESGPSRRARSDRAGEGASSESAPAKRERPAPKPRDGTELLGMPEELAYQQVFTYAGRLLSMKDWSEAGMRERLQERFKKAPQAEQWAAQASQRMREIGALDDARFARGFIRQRLGRKSLSQAAREASLKGISREVAQQAIESLREEGLIAEPMDQAFDVWNKKFGALPTDDRSRAKQARFMASRGFSYEAISKAWARAKRELDE